MDESSIRMKGLTHIYLDEKQDLFSNVAVGLLTRAIGYNLRIAYFNKKKNIFPLVDFFYKFYLQNLDFFPFNSLELNVLMSHDLIIFDNFSLGNINLLDLENILKNKNKNTEFIVVCNNKNDFDKIKDKFDLISEYKYRINKDGNNNLISIFGNGKGKSTYSFGFIVRKLIEEEFVKLIYFDKGGDFYGEKKFFDKAKYIYRKFQYFSYGESRFDGTKFRFENNDFDVQEAKYALAELHKSYDEHIIIAEELNTCIGSNLLDEENIISNLNKLENKILLTGRCSSKKLINLCKIQIEVKEIKHYAKLGEKVKKGIDF